MTIPIAIFLFLASFASITCWLLCREPAPPRIVVVTPVTNKETSKVNSHTTNTETTYEEDQPDEIIAISDTERYIRDRLATVVIPNVDFDNEPIDEVLQFLHLKLREMESTGLSGLAFVVRKPSMASSIIDGDDPTIEEGIPLSQIPTITLRETDATFTQLITRICEQGGYRWGFEENVIVYTPIE